MQLKPAGQGAFGSTDDGAFTMPSTFRMFWAYGRIGAVPTTPPISAKRRKLSRRPWPGSQQQVPPRTLYNWQNKAADLIARDLREQMRRLPR
jgi:hypothetical protein